MMRRSQQTSAQPHGREDGHEPPTRKKRGYMWEDSSLHARESKPKRHRLTASNLRRHQQESKSDLDNMGQLRKTPPGSTSTRTSVTTTDRQFGQRLRENNVVYESSFTEPPDEVEKLKKALLKDREIPSAAHTAWERTRLNHSNDSGGELSLECWVAETMLTHHDQDAPVSYSRYRNEAWTETDNEITSGISDAKPDIIETHLWAAYPKGAKEIFDELVINQYNHAMPTFAMESKGPAGIPIQALKQAAYDGALMTHAALAVDSILGKDPSQKYRKTKAITVTLDETAIAVYANHAILETDSGTEVIRYHQHQVVKVDYMLSKAEWVRAHSLLYNAQKLGLRLATLRIKAIETYFEDKKAKDTKLKAKQVKLQEISSAKTKAAMAAAPHDRMVETINKGSSTNTPKKPRPASSPPSDDKTSNQTPPSLISTSSATSSEKTSTQSPKRQRQETSTPCGEEASIKLIA